MIPVNPGPTDSPIEQAASDVDGHYDWNTQEPAPIIWALTLSVPR